MPKMIDYYAILRVPAGADLAGVENAYAQVSHELATRTAVDDTSAEALRIVNEAYSVLSHPELRREYDAEFFAADIVRQHRLSQLAQRRQRLAGWMLMSGLMSVIAIEAAAIAYLGRADISRFFDRLGF